MKTAKKYYSDAELVTKLTENATTDGHGNFLVPVSNIEKLTYDPLVDPQRMSILTILAEEIREKGAKNDQLTQ